MLAFFSPSTPVQILTLSLVPCPRPISESPMIAGERDLHCLLPSCRPSAGPPGVGPAAECAGWGLREGCAYPTRDLAYLFVFTSKCCQDRLSSISNWLLISLKTGLISHFFISPTFSWMWYLCATGGLRAVSSRSFLWVGGGGGHCILVAESCIGQGSMVVPATGVLFIWLFQRHTDGLD